MKTVIVTGASGAIGSAIAKKFIENEFFTIAQYNSNSEGIESLKKSLNGDLAKFLFPFKADFKKTEEVEKLFGFVKSNFNKCDVLVNNAGIDIYKQINDTTEKEYDNVFNVNVKAPYFLSKLCLDGMIERKKGKIVFISSIWGKVGGSMETAYSASKSALIGLTKSLAKEVAPSNINVNCVCPGVIRSPMNDIFSDEEKEEIIRATPLNRMGTPEEIAELVYFLADEKSDFITGEVITSDGGFTL